MNIKDYQDICKELSVKESIVIYFDTDEESVDNSDTMNSFLEIYEIPESDLKLDDGTYCEVNFGRDLYEVHASGNGDFKNHKIEIKLINVSNGAKKKANAIAFNEYRKEKESARKNYNFSKYKEFLKFYHRYPEDGWKKNVKYK